MISLYNKLSIRFKFVLTSSIILIIVFVSFLTFFSREQEKQALDLLKNKVLSMAEMLGMSLGYSLATNNLNAINITLDWARRDQGLAYILVLDEEGQEIAMYQEKLDRSKLDPKQNHEEKEGITISGKVINATVTITYKEKFYGTLILGYSPKYIYKNIAANKKYALYLFSVLFILTIIGVLVTSNFITRNISLLITAVQEFANKKEGKEIEIQSQDETGKLANSYNVMIRTINSAIHELQGTNEKLSAAIETQKKVEQELKDFTAVASHDLQSPLRTIVSFGERLMDEEQNLSKKGEDYLSRIMNAGMRMQALLTGLLDLSTMTIAPIKPKSIDLNQIVADVVSDLEDEITRSKAEVKVDNLPTIEADPIQMRQLFQNLIGNALKFRKPDISPCVKITSDQSKDGHCKIFVEDNGIGFDMKHLERIMRPFARLHGRSEYEGSGLGLAACNKIIARHGGAFTAQSKLGEGSVFTVTLPKKQVSEDGKSVV